MMRRRGTNGNRWIGDPKDGWKNYVFETLRGAQVLSGPDVIAMVTDPPWDDQARSEYLTALGVPSSSVYLERYCLTGSGRDINNYFGSVAQWAQKGRDHCFDPDTGLTLKQPGDKNYWKKCGSDGRPHKETHLSVVHVAEFVASVPGVVLVFDDSRNHLTNPADHASSLLAAMRDLNTPSAVWGNRLPCAFLCFLLACRDADRLKDVVAACRAASRGHVWTQ